MQHLHATVFLLPAIVKYSREIKILPCALGGRLKVYIGEYTFQTSSWYFYLNCEYWDPEMLPLDFVTAGTLQNDVTA